jgi:hypothetical protein
MTPQRRATDLLAPCVRPWQCPWWPVLACPAALVLRQIIGVMA